MSGEWLDTGHGADAAQLPTVFASGGPVATRSPQGSRPPRRLPAAIVLTAVMVLGLAGAALAIRESLFPTIGSATPRSVWQNPAPPSSTALPARPVVTSTSTTSAPTPSSTGGPVVTPGSTVPSASDDSGRGSAASIPVSTGIGSGPSASDPPGSAPDDESGHDDSGHGSDDSGSGDGSGSSGSGHSGSGADDADSDDTD